MKQESSKGFIKSLVFGCIVSIVLKYVFKTDSKDATQCEVEGAEVISKTMYKPIEKIIDYVSEKISKIRDKKCQNS